MNKKTFLISTILLVFVITLFVKCKKENTAIGTEIINKNDRLNALSIDTVSIAAYSYMVDTIITSHASNVTIGQNLDPIFGRTKASFVTQMLISNSTSFNDSATAEGVTADSLILFFQYPSRGLQVYGDNSVNSKIDIKRVNTYLDFTQTYPSNYNVEDLNLTDAHSFTFNPKEIIEAANAKAKADRQALIDSALAKNQDTSKVKKIEPKAIVQTKMPDQVCKDVYAALVKSIKQNATFVEEFNGFYFTPSNDAENGAISIFDYNNVQTRALLYYHKNNKPKEVKNYAFSFGKFATHFNVFEHNYSEGNIIADFNPSSNKRDSVVYLQGLSGLRVNIEFPYIEAMSNKGQWAVSQAELVLTIPENTKLPANQYPEPEEIMLYRVDEHDQIFVLQEFLYKKAYFGEKCDDNKYVFDITVYMQQILRGEHKGSKLLLSIKNEKINPARLVLGANDHSKPITLKMIATKL